MSRIFCTGDIHGSHSINKLSSKKWKEGKELSRDDYLIILGDFGVIWGIVEDKQELYLKNWLGQKKFTTLFLSGNHENHSRLLRLETSSFLGGKVGIVSDSIFHLRTGEVYEISGKKFLVIGGARSWDREGRTENVSWWKDEEISDEQKNNTFVSLEKHHYCVDYILAHTLPDSVAKSVGFETSPKRNGCSVSNFLDKIVESVTFKEFYCGHWHDEIDDGKYHVLYGRIVEIK